MGGLQRRCTPLHPATGVERVLGMEGLYFKLEGATPSGNHKHGMAQVAIRAAILDHNEQIAVASCGSFAVSVALLCVAHRLRCTVFAPAGLADLPRSPWVTLDEGFDTYEDAVSACDAWSRERGALNATAGHDLGEAYLSVYAGAAREIIAELGQAPAAVLCPAGNGTTVASIYRGFARAQGPVPPHFAVTVPENGFGDPCPPPDVIDWATEPLRSSRPLDRAGALRAVNDSGGTILTVERDELERAQALIREAEGIECHPASAAPVAAIGMFLERGGVSRGGPVVAILTTGTPRVG